MLLIVGIYWDKSATEWLFGFSSNEQNPAKKQKEISKNYENLNVLVKNKRNLLIDLLKYPWVQDFL